MFRTFLPALAMLALAAAAPAADELRIGDPAPPLAIDEWLRGDAVAVTSPPIEKILVIEFWATWCPPCRTSVPHLSELQQRFKDDVVIVGISDEPADKIRAFIRNMDGEMDYTVARDADHRTSARYMEAVGATGIPHAFVVDREGRFVWHGHPMAELEEVLEQVVADEFAPEEAAHRAERRETARALVQVYLFLKDRVEEPEVMALIGETFLERAHDDADTLNDFAWMLVAREEAPGDEHLAVAARAAERAAELSDPPAAGILDTLARVRFRQGRTADAIDLEQQALELARDDEALAEHIPDMEAQLEMFKDAAAE